MLAYTTQTTQTTRNLRTIRPIRPIFRRLQHWRQCVRTSWIITQVDLSFACSCDKVRVSTVWIRRQFCSSRWVISRRAISRRLISRWLCTRTGSTEYSPWFFDGVWLACNILIWDPLLKLLKLKLCSPWPWSPSLLLSLGSTSKELVNVGDLAPGGAPL